MMSKRSSKDVSKRDFEQNLNGITQNAVFPLHLNEFNYQPRTLIDETLETIDPTPDVYSMFIQFNQLFFWKKLDTIYVRWSQRMTTCAGTCTFHPRSRECVIALSAPLLKLRPRKDLVETLLHEMIHGYLFVTNNNRDRDGHGPEFCKHMHRINKAAGTNISIYHDFHDEVRLYQQHWWKCDGPCKNRPPYYGTVRRAMNRAPGPSDFWWSQHQSTCGGKFIKIREPEKPQKTRSKSTKNVKSPISSVTAKPKDISKPLPNQNTLDKFITSSKGDISPPSTASIGANGFSRLTDVDRTSRVNTVVSGGLIKLGNSTNNVYGFGTGGPGSISSKSPINKPAPKRPNSFRGSTASIGGKETGRSRLLDLYSSPSRPTNPKSKNMDNINDATNRDNTLHQCPVCNQCVSGDINSHIDICLNQESTPKRPRMDENNKNLHECPICGDKFTSDQINCHIEFCLPEESHDMSNLKDFKVSLESTRWEPTSSMINAPFSSSTLPKCPLCNGVFSESTINNHVDLCLSLQAIGENSSTQFNTPNHKNRSFGGKYDNLETIDLTTPDKSKDIINCVTCDKDIKANDYYSHIQKCLSDCHDRRRQTAETIEIPDDIQPSSSRTTNSSTTHYKCLVCGNMINNSITLEVHLEVCVKVAFHDSNDSLEDIDNMNTYSKNSTKKVIDKSTDNQHLCPICMDLFPEEFIAIHVDQCDKFII